MELTLAAAAKSLGVSVDTVKRRMRRGELTGRQIPRPQGYTWMVTLAGEGDPANTQPRTRQQARQTGR